MTGVADVVTVTDAVTSEVTLVVVDGVLNGIEGALAGREPPLTVATKTWPRLSVTMARASSNGVS